MKQPLECNYCGMEFSDDVSLSEHKKLHLIGSDFNCTECEFVVPTRSSLKTHMAIHVSQMLCGGNCTLKLQDNSNFTIMQFRRLEKRGTNATNVTNDSLWKVIVIFIQACILWRKGPSVPSIAINALRAFRHKRNYWWISLIFSQRKSSDWPFLILLFFTETLCKIPQGPWTIRLPHLSEIFSKQTFVGGKLKCGLAYFKEKDLPITITRTTALVRVGVSASAHSRTEQFLQEHTASASCKPPEFTCQICQKGFILPRYLKVSIREIFGYIHGSRFQVDIFLYSRLDAHGIPWERYQKKITG